MKLSAYIHCFVHSLRLLADKKYRIPLTINLQITNKCYNPCSYCSYDKNIPDLLTLEILKKIFKDIRSLGGIRINFTGGEPLIRSDLYDVLLLCKSNGLFVSIATSGYNAKEQIDALKLADRVMLSFDGPDFIRNKLCGEKSSKEAFDAVLLFKKHTIPFWTTTVLSRTTIPYIDWIVEHARKNNSMANFVPINIQQNTGLKFHPSLEEVSHLMPSSDEYKTAIGHIIDLKKKGAPIGSSLLSLKELFGWDDYTQLYSDTSSPLYTCMAGRAYGELLSNGMLYICGWSLSRQEGISVLDKGFKEAFWALKPLASCNSCASSCQLESNLIFNLNVRTLLNWAQKIKN